MDLLYHFFPDSVDRLDSEKSKAHGEFPVVLESGSDTEVLQTIFGTYTSDNSSLKFGSEQVILVRQNRDKEKVINQIGNSAMVLTIKESKGLEFQVKVHVLVLSTGNLILFILYSAYFFCRMFFYIISFVSLH